jgi:thioredoxin reductase
VFTNGIEIPTQAHAQLATAGISIETRLVKRLVSRDGALSSIELTDGASVPCTALFAHPPQRQVDLVRELDVALDEHGYVKTDPMTRETSRPGVYAAGDLASRMQAAIVAAAAAMQAAAAINLDLALS